MNKVVRWGLLLSTLVVLGSAALAVKIVFFDSHDVVVPSLIGKSAAESGGEAQKLGLLVRIDRISSTQPEGVVVSQWPDAGGSIQAGRVLILKVSKGGDRLPVPDVRGLDFGEAVRRISEVGLKVGDVLRVSDPLKPAGTVIAQNPASPASIPPSRSVGLLMSEGGAGAGGMVPVPNVVGQPLDVAQRMLAGSGLSQDLLQEVPSLKVAPGLVVSMRPRAGFKAPPGSRVTLVVARAPLDGEEAAPLQGTEVPPATGTAPATATPRVSPPVPTAAPTAVPAAEVLPTPVPKAEKPEKPAKTARIRYQVPPLSQPLGLRIEIVDPAGTRVLRDAKVSGGEYVTLDAPYRGEAKVLIYLGGDLIWQDRYE
jgi:serine/threonine-protein kinase